MVDGATLVNTVYDPVSVVLHSCRENDNFVKLTQLCQKLVAIWSDHVKEVIFTIFELLEMILIILHIVLWTYKVNERLIQVEYKSVWLVQNIFGWQKWWKHLWQLVKQVIHIPALVPGLALWVLGFCSWDCGLRLRCRAVILVIDRVLFSAQQSIFLRGNLLLFHLQFG